MTALIFLECGDVGGMSRVKGCLAGVFEGDIYLFQDAIYVHDVGSVLEQRC